MKVNQRTIGSDLSSIAAAIEAEQDKAGQQDLPVVVRPDPNVQQKYVVTVMDAAAQRNIKSLQVVCQ
jgi:biopolymer transport protein ExbD